MSTNVNATDNDTVTDPIDSPADYDYTRDRGRDVWTHQETGLQVTVEQHRKPTQMHTPETATDDVGYRVEVRADDGVAEPLHEDDLGDKDAQRDVAREFMQTFPGGGYEPEVAENAWEWGEVRWRDAVDDGGDA